MIKQKIKSQACALKHALCIGLVDVIYVVDWADTLIGHAEEVDDWLEDLARCKTASQAMTLLANVPSEATAEQWWPLFKQKVAKALEAKAVNLQTVVSYCYNLALSGDIPAYDCDALYQLELEYDSLFTGYGTQAEVDTQVVKFFNKPQ
ncbi:hypothetical protein [Paraglaciecola sp.]|uniref:hypothetical protein n=1 Tax=Paraglaciecola sp. TaxID=1920173 RepID=UPI0030F48C69